MPPWKKVKLCDVCSEITYGYTESANWQPVGPKFLRITDIQFDHINWKTVPFCKLSDSDHIKYKLKKGDIVIARTGNSTGAISTIKDDIDAVFASYLIRYRTIRSIANPFFVDFVMRSNKWKDFVNNIKGGSAQPGANAKQFGEFEFDIPDIDTQSRIASILSAFDDKIELNSQMNDTLEQMAQALFKKYFVAGINPDNLPEGWRWGKLIDEFEITMGQSPPGSSYNEEKNGIPFFQGRTDFEFRFPSIRVYTTDPKRLAKKLDTLLSVRAPVGDINVANEKCCIGRGLAALRSQNGYQSYCFYKLRSLSETFNMYNGEGTVFGSINKDTLGSLATVIPNRKTLEQFEKLVQPLDEHIFTLSNEISILISIRNSLLPKLMNGEIPVDLVSLEESPKVIVA